MSEIMFTNAQIHTQEEPLPPRAPDLSALSGKFFIAGPATSTHERESAKQFVFSDSKFTTCIA